MSGVPRIFLVLVFFCSAFITRGASADQIACTADGHGSDSCDITYPNVLAASTQYPNLVFAAGDTVQITAGGCVQTGGKGATWKRYVDPSGSNSDHLYHGLISIPGTTSGLTRLSSVMGRALPASSGGILTLGYEDDGYGDNGYYSHDNGTDNQCSDQSGFNQGRAWIHLNIHHTIAPFLTAGATYGMCHTLDSLHEVCHIDRPDVTHSTEIYHGITLLLGDMVQVAAAGCVQTGGRGATWKRYVNPSGPDSDRLYHGLISIPGSTNGMVRIAGVAGQNLPTSTGGILTLGYEDDGYGDNGYWSHDDGTENQCKSVGPASLDLTITHITMSRVPHVVLDGLEVTQAIQDMNGTVPLVAAKATWVRAYFSSTILPGPTVTATLSAQQGSGGSLTISSVAPAALVMAASLQSRRESWNRSLNFQLPASVTATGDTTIRILSVEDQHGTVLVCDACNLAKTVPFKNTPPLRVRIISLTYSGGSPAVLQAPSNTV